MKLKNCKYFKECGGCKFNSDKFKEQNEYKYNIVKENLSKYGKVNPLISMDNPYNYRNKSQISYAYDDKHNVIMGNYESSTHNIVHVENCNLVDENTNKIFNTIYKLILKYKISIFDEINLKGCIRHVLVKNTNQNEYMVVFVTGSLNIYKKELLIKELLKEHPYIVSIIQNINNKHTSMILSNNSKVLYGKAYIVDKLMGFSFKISSSSFYQVNKTQTEVLYSKAIELANFKGSEKCIDAYCGTGTIGMLVSKHVREVIGVEINESAVKDAISNAKYNKIDNISFICDDAGKFMERFSKSKEMIDFLIMDPPRNGADDKFLKSLIKLSPRKILYISCNPITLKSNLDYLCRYYKVDTIQPVDMFPFTSHVECIALIQRVKS